MDQDILNDTIDSVPRHREVGRAKDLSAPLVYKYYRDFFLRKKSAGELSLPLTSIQCRG